ncbi:MAG TPA: hypothetical protein G4N97_04775 [Thermoflexia bacterium]|nr:hypothetical protein [Thermoflexia bacterium]
MERLQEIEDQALLQGLVMEAVQAESLEAFWASLDGRTAQVQGKIE